MECVVCKQVFRDNFNLTRHLKTHVKPNVAYKPRLCSLCKQEFKDFHEHLHEMHNVTLQKDYITFSDQSEFISWKEKMEQETKSRFVKHSGSSKRKDGSVYTYYYCHRAGEYVPKSKDGTCKKIAGSNKIQANCPASIRTTEDIKGKVSVCFISTHVGHSCEINRLSLTVSEREKLAEQIRIKIPLEDILQGIRNSLEEDNLQRIHLTTKKDLRNLIVQYGLDSDTPDINDAEAVDKWVKFMKDNGNIIHLYKPQGILDPNYPHLEEADFCLVFANEEQLSVLKKYGNDILCVDGIYGQLGYDFQLFTILVLDEIRTGYPCAFMFSNRSDSTILNIFFSTIVKSVGCPLSPKYFISDMDETFFNAWTSLFPINDIQQLYAAWHVDREWQQYLNKIKSEEKKVEVYKNIKVLMLERDRNAFHEMSEILMNELSNSDLTSSFAQYFEEFIHEPSKWAYCYRLEVGINTDMVVEAFHKNLKHIYQAGKRGKKLIKSIHALQKFLRDRVFQRTNENCKGSVSKKLACLRKRHHSSLELSVDSVHTLGEDSWTIFSGTETYSVSLCKKDCDCSLKCEECAACVHSFSCTCTDYAVLWNMCKHIHLVCRAISVQVLEIYQEYSTEQTSDSDSLAKEDVIVIELTPNSGVEDVDQNQKDVFFEIANIENAEVKSQKSLETLKQFISDSESFIKDDIVVIQLVEQKLSTNDEAEDVEQGKKDALSEITNIVNAEVKSEKGLEVLKQLISPLKEAIRSAEEVSGHFSCVSIEEEINDLPPPKRICIQNNIINFHSENTIFRDSDSECFHQLSGEQTDDLPEIGVS